MTRDGLLKTQNILQKQNSVTTTTTLGYRGAFKNVETRTEFFKLD